jgi:hypothetical protein
MLRGTLRVWFLRAALHFERAYPFPKRLPIGCVHCGSVPDVSPAGSIEVVAHHRIFVLLGRIEGGILVNGDRSVIEVAVEVAAGSTRRRSLYQIKEPST